MHTYTHHVWVTEIKLLKCHNFNICQIEREATYTDHTRMSQLVPVLEVMLGVAGHRLTFDIGCQAQLYKKNKNEPQTVEQNRTFL